MEKDLERGFQKCWCENNKILRAWFSTEMGELGVPDRFVDIFQGRTLRTVLAKHYTGKSWNG